MAKKVTALIKLQVNAGKATPAPPIGPALGHLQDASGRRSDQEGLRPRACFRPSQQGQGRSHLQGSGEGNRRA